MMCTMFLLNKHKTLADICLCQGNFHTHNLLQRYINYLYVIRAYPRVKG